MAFGSWDYSGGATWYRASGRIFGQDNQPPRSWSAFYDFNLARWLLGASFERDDCWFDFNVDVGPLHLSLCYWRPLPDVGLDL